jgi:diaminohydroxyphosphoribosylaminopyrimidine deaminase/5-amino-6-(5-phosphoribosylamino)uracil reductase
MERQLPWVRLKVAASLDGRTAMANGESQWITAPQRAPTCSTGVRRSCAVMTGIGTVLADDAQLTVRDDSYAIDGVIRQPLRVVLDSTLRAPPSAKLFSAPGKTMVATVAAKQASCVRRSCERPVRRYSSLRVTVSIFAPCSSNSRGAASTKCRSRRARR